MSQQVTDQGSPDMFTVVRSNSTKINKSKLKKRISAKALSATFNAPFQQQLKPRPVTARSPIISPIVSPRKKDENTFYFEDIDYVQEYTEENPRAVHTTVHTILILGAPGSGKTGKLFNSTS